MSILLPSTAAAFLALKLQKVTIIGLTGCIASGKSTLTKLIASNYKDIDIIDCDQIAHRLRKHGEPGYNLIMRLLGDKATQSVNPSTLEIEE
jgi:dephospho-CoA kinase